MKENILVKSSKNFMTIMELDIRLHAYILLKKKNRIVVHKNRHILETIQTIMGATHMP